MWNNSLTDQHDVESVFLREEWILMEKIRELLMQKKFLEASEKALEMSSAEWEARYISVLVELNREERRSATHS